MLSREVMGWFALGVLWLNTLLIVGATWQQVRALLARLARLKPVGESGQGLWHGRVTSGDGHEGALAVHTIEQVARSMDRRGANAMLFHDRRFANVVSGGSVELTSGEQRSLRVSAASGTDAEVWPEAQRQSVRAACPSDEAFDAAYADARKARGFARTLETPIGTGDPVWIVGEMRDGTIGAPAGSTLWISAFDPAPWIARKVALAIGFVVFAIVGSAIVTIVATWKPVFGTVSTIGAAVGLGYFLGLLMPGGVAVRDALRVPSETFVRGQWTRPRAPDR